MTVVPRPREIEQREGRIRLEDIAGITHNDGTPDAAVDRLTETLERETGVALSRTDGESDHAVIAVSIEDNIDAATNSREAYRLEVTTGGIDIAAPSSTGVHYAAQTLAGLVTRRDGVFTLPVCEICDWPRHEIRSVMVDPARKFIPIDRLYEIVDKMARAKLNRLHLHLLDNESYALESKAYPELGEGPGGGQRPTYSHEEMEQLVTYAADRDVTVLPEIDVPGHALHVLTKRPELRCDLPDDFAVFGPKPAVCLGKEAAYEFVETLVEEVCSVFPSDVVHLGVDEWSHHGVSWERCMDCQAYMDRNDIANVQELFYDFLRRAGDILADHGKTMGAWNDQIDISESPDIPSNIQIHFWIVSYPPWGPDFEGNSMDRFLEEGYEVVNHHTAATYLNTLRPERLLDWNPTRFPEASGENASNVHGGGLACWGDPSTERRVEEYYRRAIPSAFPVFADRVWNGIPIEDRSRFRQSVTRHVLGPSIPDGYDVYADLGGVVLPSFDDGYADKANVDTSLSGRTIDEAIESYESNIESLTVLETSGEARFPDAVDAYVDALEWLIKVAERTRNGLERRPDRERQHSDTAFE